MKKFIYLFFIAIVAFSCGHGGSKQTIEDIVHINLMSDDGISINGSTKIKLAKGATWQIAKPEVEKKVSCNDGYIDKVYHLGDVQGEVLEDAYVFDKDTTVFVESIKDKWTKVKYEDLREYLSKKAKKGETNYIWVTEVLADNMQGGKSGAFPKPSEFGKILQEFPNVNVALKFDERIEGLKKMNAAFLQCKNLVAIENIPIGVENLEMCFAGCGILEEVKNIPNTVKSLKNCFTTCAFLKTPPIIPEGVEDMSDCFAFCTELETPPILPKTVTNLEECFLSCLKLKKAPEIPENVTNMASMFVQCFALEEMPEIPGKVKRFRHAFMGCEALTKTKAVPESVNDMQGAFLGCKEITSIALNCKYNNEKGGADPEREGYFFENAFVGCEKLGENSISVPSAYLADYKKGATNMGVSENYFVGK